MTKVEKNLYGQEMRNKGQMTRTRIIEATAQLMAQVPIRDLRVAEIGRIAKVSKATFYIYFESVAEAALAVVQTLNQATPEVMDILDSEWTPENILAKARALVIAYTDYWEEHHALLRVRNFTADEGDKRFIDARRVSVEPIHFALQAKVVGFQKAGISPASLHPASTASVLLAMLERLSAIMRLPSAHGATRGGERESAAVLLTSALAPSAMSAATRSDQD